MIKIHGAPTSPFVRKTLLTLEYKGVEFANDPVFPGSDDPAFRAISPFGMIPVLENEFGVTLFHRNPDGVYPTDQCQILLEHGTIISDEIERACNRISAHADWPGNRIHIGCSVIPCTCWLRDTLAELLNVYPETRLSVTLGRASEQIGLLRARLMNLVLCDTAEVEDDRDVLIEHLPSEPFLFVCDKNHPLGVQKMLTGEDMLHYRLVAPQPVQRAVRYFSQFMPDDWSESVDSFVDKISCVRIDNYEVVSR